MVVDAPNAKKKVVDDDDDDEEMEIDEDDEVLAAAASSFASGAFAICIWEYCNQPGVNFFSR